METSLPMICGCTLRGMLILFTKRDDELCPLIEVGCVPPNSDPSVTGHNLTITHLGPGHFAVRGESLYYGCIKDHKKLANFTADLVEQMHEWCEQANSLLYPARSSVTS